MTGFQIRNSKHLRGEAPIEVALEDGTIIYMTVPTHRRITIGQSIEVDILESENKKPRYRLARTPNPP